MTQCLLFCLAGIFVSGRLSDLLSPLAWWAFHQSQTTFLERSSFVATYYLPLIEIYGFGLGLIPVHRLKELSLHSLARLNSDPTQDQNSSLADRCFEHGLLLVCS
jgi:hypothetical protein